MRKKFRIVSGNKRKSTASNLAEMGEGGFAIIPEFIGSLTIVCRSAGEVG